MKKLCDELNYQFNLDDHGLAAHCVRGYITIEDNVKDLQYTWSISASDFDPSLVSLENGISSLAVEKDVKALVALIVHNKPEYRDLLDAGSEE